MHPPWPNATEANATVAPAVDRVAAVVPVPTNEPPRENDGMSNLDLMWMLAGYASVFIFMGWAIRARTERQRRLREAATVRVRIEASTELEAIEQSRLAAILALPISSLEAEFAGDCALCMEPMEPGAAVRDLECRHFFHVACVDRWWMEGCKGRSRSCPSCRADPLSPPRSPALPPVAAAGPDETPAAPRPAPAVDAAGGWLQGRIGRVAIAVAVARGDGVV